MMASASPSIRRRSASPRSPLELHDYSTPDLETRKILIVVVSIRDCGGVLPCECDCGGGDTNSSSAIGTRPPVDVDAASQLCSTIRAHRKQHRIR